MEEISQKMASVNMKKGKNYLFVNKQVLFEKLIYVSNVFEKSYIYFSYILNTSYWLIILLYRRRSHGT